MNCKKMKNLFLRQSCLDSWTDYENSLAKPSFIKWDYLVLTASNELEGQLIQRVKNWPPEDRIQIPIDYFPNFR